MLKCIIRSLNHFIPATFKISKQGLKNFPFRRNISKDPTESDNLNSKRSTIRIRKVLSKDISSVLKLFHENYSICEPLVKGLQFPENSFSPALVEFWRNSIEHGLSFVAVPNRMSTTDQSCGGIINTKLTPWETEQWLKFSSCIRCPKCRDLINLTSFLLKDADLHERFQVTKIFNIAYVLLNQQKCFQMNPELTTDTLGTILVDKSLKVASLEGYKLASFVCTGPNSAKYAENLQMQLIYDFPYGKLVNEKFEPLVKDIDPNTNVKIYIKELKKNLHTNFMNLIDYKTTHL